MVTVAKLQPAERKKLLSKRDLVNQKSMELMTDNEFDKSISVSTQKTEHVKIRHEKIQKLLREVLDA